MTKLVLESIPAVTEYILTKAAYVPPAEPVRELPKRSFYDYDMVITSAGDERYILRVGMQRLPNKRFCRITRQKDLWVRKTSGGSNGSIRYHYYTSLDKAMQDGIAWEKRRDRRDRKEMEERVKRLTR
jgi:hypothetical protein